MFWKKKEEEKEIKNIEPDPNRETYWHLGIEPVYYPGMGEVHEHYKILCYKDTGEQVSGELIDISYPEYCRIEEEQKGKI